MSQARLRCISPHSGQHQDEFVALSAGASLCPESIAYRRVDGVQGNLTHDKQQPHRTLQQPYAQGPMVILGWWVFFMSEYSCTVGLMDHPRMGQLQHLCVFRCVDGS